MLTTHLTLVKITCLVFSIVLFYNIVYLPFVFHEDQASLNLAHQESGNDPLPSLVVVDNLTLHTPIYVEAPSTFDSLFPPLDFERKGYHDWNAKALRDLHVCIALDNCGPNQMKVALLAESWIVDGVARGSRGGESVWGISMYRNLHELGYTILLSTDFDQALSQYRMMPDLVKVVIRSNSGHCHNDRHCVKNSENPTGIPSWKIFDFSYWPDNRLGNNDFPMKGKWLLSANPDYDYPDFESSLIQYIGYSTEHMCTKIPLVPLEERKTQVWMLMKQLIYVYHPRFAWNRTYFPLIHEELDIDFVGGWEINKDYLGWGKDIEEEILEIEDREKGVYNFGMLPIEAFYDQVRDSIMMIGMVNPAWSPSPIEALCLGVPFLNPISSWDYNDPWNKSRWDTQHRTLVEYDPPYVYHVHAKNFTGFLEAVKGAINNPIGRFIPEHMTEKSVQGRLHNLMETDWRAKAEIVLRENERKVERGEEAYIFEL
ncbi:hypothetical protein Agabi119p4_9457 [Agaricus bisporus var. burnettii]|uniref:Glycosyltransferase family 18 catalytic domain-containing protein n=1 Tax=Agaricus bisporus var. burnettii TaxID=192524 RepID=A0A8H7C3N8_AGABI|nr:hypothetical protein Agabi119p4_9457 [Agaricus bisporus var. burnettii]